MPRKSRKTPHSRFVTPLESAEAKSDLMTSAWVVNAGAFGVGVG
jgi:hypothetical protein